MANPNTNDPMYGFNNPSMRQPPTLSSLPRGLMQSANNATRMNPSDAANIRNAVGFGLPNVSRQGVIGATTDAMESVANTYNSLAPKVGNAAKGLAGRALYGDPNAFANSQTQQAQTVSKNPIINQAQATPTQTAVAQLPKPSIIPAGLASGSRALEGEYIPRGNPSQEFVRRADDIIARGSTDGPAQSIGYVQTTGNSGNYNPAVSEGPSGMRYDAQGKPIFDAEGPTTYGIENGKITKYGQDGKPVGLGGTFSAGLDTSAVRQQIAQNQSTPQVSGLPTRAPQMQDYSGAVDSLYQQVADNKADSSDSIGTLVMKGINRRAAQKGLSDMLGAQSDAQRTAASYGLGQQDNLLDAQKAAMSYQNDARNLQNSEQQQDFNQRLGLAELALKARPQPTEYQPIFEDQWDDQAGAVKKVYMGNLDKRTGAISRPEGMQAQQSNTQQSIMQTPKVGDVVSGYKFLGGNPNDQKSWQKV